DLFLRSQGPTSPQVVPRWLYVMNIDCTGKGVLLYPRNGIENKRPREGENGTEIPVLSQGYLKVGPPFGTDTYILLATDEPLPDPAALNFEGVITKGSRGHSPLQDLLDSASKGTRGVTTEIPTQWSAQTVHVVSAPRSTRSDAS